MKKIIIFSLIIGIMCLIGCPNGQKTTEDEKTPVIDANIGGTWVNDSTPDISFTLDRYLIENFDAAELQIKVGSTTFTGSYDVKGSSNNGYLSLDDLSSDTSNLIFYVKDTNGNSFYIQPYARYINNKIRLSDPACVPVTSTKKEKSEDFQRLLRELSGFYSKK